MKKVLTAVALCALFATPSLADPPPGAPTTGPIPDWFHSLTVPDGNGMGLGHGALCCDVADCRRVKAKFENGHWWAFIDSVTFPDDDNTMHGHAPNNWVQVSDGAVIPRDDNPTGGAVACWYARQLRCFVRYFAS